MGRFHGHMVPLGCYFIHRTTLPCSDIPFREFHVRATLTNYPSFLRYRICKVDDLYLVLSARGIVIVVQPIKDVLAIDEARVLYDDNETFARYYGNALKSARTHLGIRHVDFEDSSLAWFGAPKTNISWRTTELSMEEDQRWPISVFIESLLIFSACKEAEAVLARQLNNPTNVATTKFIDASKDLVFIENPSDLLVNGDEITLLTLFYQAWEIGRTVRSIQARYGQVITVLSLHASKVQSERAMTLNLLVGCATVLALLPVADNLHEMIGHGVSTMALKETMVGASVIFAMSAILRGKISQIREWISEVLLSWTVRRRVARLIRTAASLSSQIDQRLSSRTETSVILPSAGAHERKEPRLSLRMSPGNSRNQLEASTERRLSDRSSDNLHPRSSGPTSNSDAS